MDIKKKLQLCVLGNLVSLIIVVMCVIIFNSNSLYFSFGPSEQLIVISVRINSWIRYIFLLIIITIVNAVQVMSDEMGTPILGFSIYNPDKKHITDFTKFELQLYANIMFLIGAIRRVFMVIISITQIDIALYSIFIKELTSVVTIRFLLNEKTFGEQPLLEELDEIEIR
jgi:hypothetical protein